jgi:hypothetical protein
MGMAVQIVRTPVPVHGNAKKKSIRHTPAPDAPVSQTTKLLQQQSLASDRLLRVLMFESESSFKSTRKQKSGPFVAD